MSYLDEALLQKMKGRFFVLAIAVGVVVLFLCFWLIRQLMLPADILTTGYGRTRGNGYANSVNGVGVLAKMFQGAGHRVSSATSLSPRLEDAEIMVWAPDDFAPPSEEVRQYVLDWLDYHNGRTFIYIGRDFDAAADYWQEARALSDDSRVRRVEREGAFAETSHLKLRYQVEDASEGGWFVTDTRSPPIQVKELGGDWADDVDSAKTEIMLDVRLIKPKKSGSLDPSYEFETLLTGDDEPLVTRITRKGGPGEILIVQNGSFLLNYPLVNHEHRKLAAKLVDHCGQPGKVVFIESGPWGLSIIEKEATKALNAFSVIKVWPINIIMLHVALLGVLYCFARYPIFGRPRTLQVETTADFGTHVTALGELLGRSKNATYAQQRLMHYRQQGQRGSGKGHRPLPGLRSAAEKK